MTHSNVSKGTEPTNADANGDNRDHNAPPGWSQLMEALGATPDSLDPLTEKDSHDPNLSVVFNAKSLRLLSEAISHSCASFGKQRNTLEREVATQTECVQDLSGRLELVLDSISDGLIAFDDDGRIESCNKAAQQILETQEDPTGHWTVQTLFDGNNLLKSELVPGREMHILTQSGNSKLIEYEIQPILHSPNNAQLISFRDITQAQHTKKQLQDQTFLIDNVNASVIVWTPQDGIQWCNPYALALTGYSHDDLVGTNARWTLVDESTPEESLVALDNAVRQFSSYDVELIIRHKSGRLVWIRAEGHPMFSENRVLEKYVTIGTDITDRKRQEQLQLDFCSMVSHELRTPLTVVSGAFDAVLAGMAGTLSDSAQELLGMGSRNCAQLSVLIEDILDVNKLESGSVRLESRFVPVTEITNEAIETLSPIISEAGVSITTDFIGNDDCVFVDPQRLIQVLTNLISNAIKYSHVGAKLTVGTCRVDETIRISVQDNGPGIASEFRPHIFERFSRDTQVQASGKEGFGLGLSICKSLVDQMSGEISFETKLGEGTTFFVDLPRGTRPSHDATPNDVTGQINTAPLKSTEGATGTETDRA